MGRSHRGGCNGFAYSITEPEHGLVTWTVHGGVDHQAHGQAVDVATARVACDTARRLLECVAWLEGRRWPEADGAAIERRLAPIAEAATQWESRKAGGA